MKSPCAKCDQTTNREKCSESCIEIALYQESIRRNPGVTCMEIHGCNICRQPCEGDYCDDCRASVSVARPKLAPKIVRTYPGPRKKYQHQRIYPRRYLFTTRSDKVEVCEYCKGKIQAGHGKLYRQSGGKMYYAHMDCAKRDTTREIRIRQKRKGRLVDVWANEMAA